MGKKKTFQVDKCKADGNTIRISSGSCKVLSKYLWGDDWKRLERSWARNLQMLRGALLALLVST